MISDSIYGRVFYTFHIIERFVIGSLEIRYDLCRLFNSMVSICVSILHFLLPYSRISSLQLNFSIHPACNLSVFLSDLSDG